MIKHVPKWIAKVFSRFIPIKACSSLSIFLLFFIACHQQGASHEHSSAIDQAALKSAKNADTSLTEAEKANKITIVNWNIEWLGSASNGPRDKPQQLQNAARILQYLKADLYCLCEIVDPKSLDKLTDALGGQYSYVISPYASGARSNRDPGYPNAQKLAFIYNTQKFKNVKTRGYLQSDARLGFYFASGRYPFELTATVHTAEVDQQVNFLIIHGKSGSDKSSYERRLKAATALKGALDKEKSKDAVMLLGDFNDHMEGSITQGQNSPYKAFVMDSAYHVLTLALARQKSTLDYAGVIDQQIISSTLNKYYLSGSTRIRTDITTVVPDFKSGTTSDHYPVSSEYIFDKKRFKNSNSGAVYSNPAASSTAKTKKQDKQDESAAYQNRQQKVFTAGIAKGSIVVRAAEKSQHIRFILYNKRRHKVLSVSRKYILKGDSFRLKTPVLYAGDYTLVIYSDHGKQDIAFSVK